MSWAPCVIAPDSRIPHIQPCLTGGRTAALRENTDNRCTFARGDITDQLELDACDLGLCIGVLEHIPTDRIDTALDTIASLSTQQVISICPHSSRHGLHLTVKPADWWEQRLQDHLQIVRAGDNRFVCRS